jgi:hypothetical protein
MVALHSRCHNRFVRVDENGEVDSKGGIRDVDALPDAWEWERFEVRQLTADANIRREYGGSSNNSRNGFQAPGMQPGTVMALHSPAHQRFIRMMGDRVDTGGGNMGSADLPDDWHSERFTVVDAGHGEVSLHSSSHGRFVRMAGESLDAMGGTKQVTQYMDALVLPLPQMPHHTSRTMNPLLLTLNPPPLTMNPPPLTMNPPSLTMPPSDASYLLYYLLYFFWLRAVLIWRTT